MNWIGSRACNSRIHCVQCRTDEKWQESLRVSGLVNNTDFNCPFNVSAETARFEQDMAIAKLLNQPKGEYDAIKAEERRRRQQVGGCCGQSNEAEIEAV